MKDNTNIINGIADKLNEILKKWGDIIPIDDSIEPLSLYRYKNVTNYPLTPNQRKEVEDYMRKYNVTENEARYKLGYVPGDIGQVSITEALEMVKEENPNIELTNETLKFYLNEVMKKCIPKPNPKFAMEILIKNMNPIVCPHCGYHITMNSYSNALNVELIENKKSALMCPSCFTPF